MSDADNDNKSGLAALEDEAAKKLEAAKKAAGAKQKQVAPARQQIVQIPAGGLRALAADLWPDEREDKEKMRARQMELYNLNLDTLRDEDNFYVGQLIRVP